MEPTGLSGKGSADTSRNKSEDGRAAIEKRVAKLEAFLPKLIPTLFKPSSPVVKRLASLGVGQVHYCYHAPMLSVDKRSGQVNFGNTLVRVEFFRDADLTDRIGEIGIVFSIRNIVLARRILWGL